jgi:hypothetical protein
VGRGDQVQGRVASETPKSFSIPFLWYPLGLELAGESSVS